MILNEYRNYVHKLFTECIEFNEELNTILKNDKCKAASARARKKSIALGKKLKEFRKVSVEFCKNKE